MPPERAQKSVSRSWVDRDVVEGNVRLLHPKDACWKALARISYLPLRDYGKSMY